MLPSSNIQSIVGATVHGSDDAKIGRITKVYVDASDGHPTFAEVHTGFLGRATRYVPLTDARWEHDDVYVDFSQDVVKHSPHVEGSDGLSPEQEAELHRHYAGATDAGSDDGRDGDGDQAGDRDGDGDRDRHDEHEHRDDRGSDDHHDTTPDADHHEQDRDQDRGPAHAAGEVPAMPELQDGQVLREERLVVRREEVPPGDRTPDATGDAPRI